MILGLNSVLFGGHELTTAFEYASVAGYDGIEISAIAGMGPHLVPDRWRDLAASVKELTDRYGLQLLAIEQPAASLDLMEHAFQAAVGLGAPVVNCSPGGASGDEESFHETVSTLRQLAERAEDHGITLCVKPHVNQAVFDTATSLRALEAIDSPAFGLDMDPSHIHRAGEDPVEALAAVIDRVRHVHIRDCKGRHPHPGAPEDQTNGRGDIDLLGFLRVLHDNGYQGPVDLEVIGAREYSLTRCVAIAAEARGHIRACLHACGAEGRYRATAATA